MSKIISIHEYNLKPEVEGEQFERAILNARERRLLRLPGLVEHYFIKGIRGLRRGKYGTIWVYESREAWEKIWGTGALPRKKRGYPGNWKIWEEEVLAPFLSQDPDKIDFTVYEELQSKMPDSSY